MTPSSLMSWAEPPGAHDEGPRGSATPFGFHSPVDTSRYQSPGPPPGRTPTTIVAAWFIVWRYGVVSGTNVEGLSQTPQGVVLSAKEPRPIILPFPLIPQPVP